MPSGRGWLARQALFLRGRRPGGPDDWRYWHSAARISSPQQAPGGAIAAPPAPGASARLSSCRWFAWPPPLGRAVRACGDVVKVGELPLEGIWIRKRRQVCVIIWMMNRDMWND